MELCHSDLTWQHRDMEHLVPRGQCCKNPSPHHMPPHPPRYSPAKGVWCIRCALRGSGMHCISSRSILQMISGLGVGQPVQSKDRSNLSCTAGTTAPAAPCPQPHDLPLLCSSLLPHFPAPTASSRLALVTSATLLQTGRLGTAQTCARRGFSWTRRSISLTRGWSNTATGFLQSWLMPQS